MSFTIDISLCYGSILEDSILEEIDEDQYSPFVIKTCGNQATTLLIYEPSNIIYLEDTYTLNHWALKLNDLPDYSYLTTEFNDAAERYNVLMSDSPSWHITSFGG